MTNVDRLIDWGLTAVLWVLMAVFLVLLAYGFRGAQVGKECLERGFPKSAVAWDFEGYCLTINGDVRAEVWQVHELPPPSERRE